MPIIGNLGPTELIIILVIALVVLGPGKLPEVGSALGKSIKEFRKAAGDVREATSLEPIHTDAAPTQVAPAAPAAAVMQAPASPVIAAPMTAAPVAPAAVPIPQPLAVDPPETPGPETPAS